MHTLLLFDLSVLSISYLLPNMEDENLIFFYLFIL